MIKRINTPFEIFESSNYNPEFMPSILSFETPRKTDLKRSKLKERTVKG